MKHVGICILLVLGSISCLAGDSLKVMFYNLYRFPSATPTNRAFILGDILAEAMPDLLMTCELENEAGSIDILQNSFHFSLDSFSKADFVYNQSDTAELLQQMVFFNTKKLWLHKQVAYPTTVRDINHYTFIIPTASLPADTLFLEVFVAHLKSSTGPANRQLRYNMVDTFVKVLQTFPADRAVLFAGDFNFYNANEIGYQHLIDTNRLIKMMDPIQQPGNWQDNIQFAPIHTQATRTSATGFGLYGATGGLDDRFDFIMMSANMHDSQANIHYAKESYIALGNNGNCLNQKVNDTNCSGPFQLMLRENLHNMSDHLPIVMQLLLSDTIGSGTPNDTTQLNKVRVLNPTFVILQNYAVQNQLMLKLNMPLGNAIALEIYNYLGQRVYHITIAKDTDTVILPIETLKAGLYFVRMEGFSKMARFIKQ
jgi:hypothetical protein